jgi:hypothetical protein
MTQVTASSAAVRFWADGCRRSFHSSREARPMRRQYRERGETPLNKFTYDLRADHAKTFRSRRHSD